MKVIVVIDDVDVIKKTIRLLDLWERRNHGSPPGIIMLEFISEMVLHIEQLTMA